LDPTLGFHDDEISILSKHIIIAVGFGDLLWLANVLVRQFVNLTKINYRSNSNLIRYPYIIINIEYI